MCSSLGEWFGFGTNRTTISASACFDLVRCLYVLILDSPLLAEVVKDFARASLQLDFTNSSRRVLL
jgi:hypothetical protein